MAPWKVFLNDRSANVGRFTSSFDGLGFGLAFTASFLSGARWTFSQKVLQKSKLNLQNPIDFIYHIQPFMILTILPLAIYVEGKSMPGFFWWCWLYGGRGHGVFSGRNRPR